MTPRARRQLTALLVATVLAFVLAWLAHVLLSNAGDVVAAVLLRWPRERMLTSAFRALLAVMALPVALFAWHRLAKEAPAWIPLALVTLWVGSKYLDSIRDNDHFVFAPES